MMTEQQPIIEHDPQLESAKTCTLIVYGLQVLGLFTAIGFIIAIIVNYVKLHDVQNTWLASHFRWQIRTFWFGLLWTVLGSSLLIIFIGHFILIANYIWVIYRIIKGWLYLNDKRELVFS